VIGYDPQSLTTKDSLNLNEKELISIPKALSDSLTIDYSIFPFKYFQPKFLTELKTWSYLKAGVVTSGWYRMPPFIGPRELSCWTRNPTYDDSVPSSLGIVHSTYTMIHPM